MKELVFNRKDYKSYKDMYEDLARKTECDKIEDYFDSTTFNYNPNILLECLLCDFAYLKKEIRFILVNFDRERIRQHKTYDDYEYNMIIEVLEDFVKDYPNNKLEFRMEE